jgi:hypothetical protein
VAAKRGKSQARRNSGNRGGMPGWAWLVLGVLITLAAVLFLPRYLKTGEGDGFFRPHANPDAQPLAESPDEDEGVVAQPAADAATASAAKDKSGDKDGDFDFYTLLPSNEVALSDAQLAAAEKAEQARARSRPPGPTTMRPMPRCRSRCRKRHRRRLRTRARSRKSRARRRRPAAATTRPTCCRPARSAPAAMPRR